MRHIILLLAAIGRSSVVSLASLGRFVLFCITIFSSLRGAFYGKIFLQQLYDLVVRSLQIVALTGVFTGAVLAFQTNHELQRFGATEAIPSLLLLSVVRELGPVLCGLIMAGRGGSMLAAEISSMKISDQLVAMDFLSVSKINFVIIPRFLAAIISLPILTFVTCVWGFFGGFLVCVGSFNFSAVWYFQVALDVLQNADIIMCFIKSIFYGAIIGLVGCYSGYYAKLSARGVGDASTSAVVSASVAILFVDYLLTMILS